MAANDGAPRNDDEADPASQATPSSDAEDATAGDATPVLEGDLDTSGVDEEATQEVMSLLSEHVPLALLADLAMPEGPASPEILDEEGLPDVAWWEGEEPPEGDADGDAGS